MSKDKKKVKLPKVKKPKKIKKDGKIGQGFDISFGWVVSGFVMVITTIIILMLAFGGINQRKLVNTTVEIINNIGDKIKKPFEKFELDLNDDGIYVKPKGE